MRVIFSYVDFGLKDKNHSKIIKMAAVSNFLAQKCGYKTTLFVDKKSYIFFEKIKYDSLIILEEEITENFPSQIWSLGKLLAMSKMREPFFHIDFDLLLFKALKNSLIQKEFICLHSEKWLIFNTKIVIDIYKNLNIQMPFPPISLNCAIVGGNNFKLISKTAIDLINYALNNKNILKDMNQQLREEDKYWTLSVIFEQVLFTNLILNELALNYEDNLIINSHTYEDINLKLINNGILHLWNNKEKKINQNLIENIIKNNQIQY